MNFKNLSNENLVQQFENSVISERKITAQVLEYIAEIDRRRLYEQKNHSSLFDYLVHGFNYSPSAAVRRISAARLLRELPETAQKFEKGSLTLSQANQIQRAAMEIKKTKQIILKPEQKRELIQQIEHTTQKQTEQILATSLDLSFVPPQKETLHCDQSVTLTVTFTKEQIETLEQVQNIIAHSVPNKDWAEVITYLAKREVSRRTYVRATATDVKHTSLLKNNTQINKRLAISATTRKTLLNSHASCTYKYANGKKCESKRFLQIDHIKSVSRGGTNDPRNLQVLCGAHNRLKFFLENNPEYELESDATVQPLRV